MLHKELKTNVRKVNCGIAQDHTFPLCLTHVETNFHVLRDFSVVRPIWEAFNNNWNDKLSLFFSFYMKEWIFMSMLSRRQKGRITFGLALGTIWYAENDFFFNSQNWNVQSIAFTSLDVDQTMRLNINCLLVRHESMVTWKFPPGGLVKFNVDGLVRNSRTLAGYGGVLRNDEG